jgi:hypothetical protein
MAQKTKDPKQAYYAEAIKLHCEAIKSQNSIYTKARIGKFLFPDAADPAKEIANVQNKTNEQVTFYEMTREDILQKIQIQYVDILQKIPKNVKLMPDSFYDENTQPHFTFKQYFMTDKDENVVAAAELRLFYNKTPTSIDYKTYELTIVAATYPQFTLAGEVAKIGNTLILQCETKDIEYATTMIVVDSTFFTAGPKIGLNILYSGSYVTRSSVGETIEGKIILELVANNAKIEHYNTPKHIAAHLYGTFHKIQNPGSSETLPVRVTAQASEYNAQATPLPAFLVGTFKQFFIHATERSIGVSILKIHANGSVDYCSSRSDFIGKIVAATSNVYQIQYKPYPSGVYEVLLTFSVQTTPNGDLRSLKANYSGISRDTAPFAQRAILYALPPESTASPTRYVLPSNSQNPAEQAEYAADLRALHHEYPSLLSFLIGQDTDIFSVEKAVLDEIAAFLKA